MDIKYIVNSATNTIKGDKTKSALTLLGIFLGVVTIVLILGLGEGLIENVENTFKSFGTDILIIIPMSVKSFTSIGGNYAIVNFKQSTLDSIKNYNCLSKVSGIIVLNHEAVKYKNKTRYVMISGVDESIFDIYSSVKLNKGRFLKNSDHYVLNLGYGAANEIFDENILPGKYIEIKGKRFRVVGTFNKIGSSLGSADDQAFYIPLDTMKEITGKKTYTMIIGRISKKCNQEEVKTYIENKLYNLRKCNKDDPNFTVITSEYMLKKINEILDILYAASFSIGLIASVVSVIGIANTLFTSVLRKKKEIGILKALGAKNKDVMLIFIVESLILSFIGAGAGIVVAVIIGFILNVFSIPFVLNWLVIVLSFLLALIIGIVSSILPAYSATKISPIEAIRS